MIEAKKEKDFHC